MVGNISPPEYAEVLIQTILEQDTYSKAKIDELVAEIYKVMRMSDDYHSKRLDNIYYPFNNIIG